MLTNQDKNLDELENIINYSFKDKSLLIKALTHNSYSNEHNLTYNYERLEFLGDAILQLILSEYIIKTFTNYNEGELSQLRAFLVNEDYLSYTARELYLQDFIKVGRGESLSNIHGNKSIMADIFEALIAAIYLDSSYDTIKKLILHIFEDSIRIAAKDRLFIDEKGELQRLTQKYFKSIPLYSVIKTEGSEHDKTYTVEVNVAGKVSATATGKNKKSAEKSVALIAINKVRGFLNLK